MSDEIALPETEPLQPTPPRPVGRKSTHSGGAVLILAALVAVGGLAFAGGRLTAPTSAASTTNLPGGPFGAVGSPAPGAFVGRGFGGGVTLRGEVTAVSVDSMTIELENGASVTVPLDDETTYHMATPASAIDVVVGSTVTVQPTDTDIQPGASLDPGAGPPGLNFGPATDVTVVND